MYIVDTEKPTRTAFACLELWLFTCMDQPSWKQTQLNCSVTFSNESGHEAINFRRVSMDHLVFVENAIKHNLFIYDIDIETGILKVNLPEEVLRCTRTILIYCATTTTFAMLMRSTRSSNDSVYKACW